MEKYINEIKMFAYGIFATLQIDPYVAKILIFLIGIEMIMGGAKAARLDDLEFKKSTFSMGFLKKSTFLIVVMTLALIGKGIGVNEFKTIVSIVMKVMILNEGLSIIYSARSIYENKLYKSNDLIAIMFDRIGQLIIYIFDKTIKKLDSNSSCL